MADPIFFLKIYLGALVFCLYICLCEDAGSPEPITTDSCELPVCSKLSCQSLDCHPPNIDMETLINYESLASTLGLSHCPYNLTCFY